MDWMEKEMIDQLKTDIQTHKLMGLKLMKTGIDVTKHNVYADIFDKYLPITGFDEEKFYLEARLNIPVQKDYDGRNYKEPIDHISTDICETLEAYYEAFNFYDGHILRSVVEIPAAVKLEDRVKVNEYLCYQGWY